MPATARCYRLRVGYASWGNAEHLFSHRDRAEWRVSYGRSTLVKRRPLRRPQAHLRHALPTRSAHPKIVSEMLGHSSIAITLDTYSHVLPDMQDSAARAIEDALL